MKMVVAKKKREERAEEEDSLSFSCALLHSESCSWGPLHESVRTHIDVGGEAPRSDG